MPNKFCKIQHRDKTDIGACSVHCRGSGSILGADGARLWRRNIGEPEGHRLFSTYLDGERAPGHRPALRQIQVSDTFAAERFCDTLLAMRTASRNRLAIGALCALLLGTLSLRADQLQMQNGDRYAGHMVSMSSNSIVLESEVLGKVTLPREKVSTVTFGANATAPAPVAPTPKVAATNVNIAAALRAMEGGSNSIEQVRQQSAGSRRGSGSDAKIQRTRGRFDDRQVGRERYSQ